jgi:uncharacterized protein YndB with AHSA1/START domain
LLGRWNSAIGSAAKEPSMSDHVTDDRDLVVTRLINAPRAKLFQAWTQPELLKRWFAPAPVTTPVVEVDLRVGGA